MRRCHLSLFLLALAMAGRAEAVTIRDDVTDASSQTLAGSSEFQSVGKFTRSDNDITSGVLINSQYVLTAAHIIQGYAGNAFTFTIGGLDYATISYSISGQDDLAIFQLATPVLNVTPALVYTGTSELNKTATVVGFGLGGNGTTGIAAGNGLRGTKRAATNVIDTVDPRLIAFDFDSGLVGDNVSGSFAQTSSEGLLALGDSGGGTFATIGGQTYLIGIHSGVNADGDAYSYDYGEQGVDVRVSAASSFIQTAIPEPSSWVLVGMGVGWLGARRRQRQGWVVS